MSPVGVVLAAVAEAYRGDPEALVDLLADDATWVDTVGEPPLTGPERIAGHFLAHGGRREAFTVHHVIGTPPVVAVRWTLRFQADAATFAHEGWARLSLDDDRLAGWQGLWVEIEDPRGST